ncbi:hypothetical protein ONZ45_g8737 [Pleurotus djamor]|nr:hypothetical protein ONZ45_g8737 [Pleurotus djamor]
MASFNLTVEDYSPLITYAPVGAWIDTPVNASIAQSYSGASFHTTSAQDASATILFNGTGISIFGSKQPNYGSFRFTVDGVTAEEGSAGSSSFQAKQLLGKASGLNDGAHTAVLTYTGGGSGIDIDSLVLDGQVSGGATHSTTTFDDTDPKIVYAPASAWNENSRPVFINNTLHFTSSPDATASMTFFGDALAVYGTVAPDHADIQVTLDGQTRTLKGGAGGHVRTLRTQTLLYYASNLGDVEHQIQFKAAPTENAPFLDLDAITVYSALHNTGSPSSGQDGTPATVPPPDSTRINQTAPDTLSKCPAESSTKATNFNL